MIPILAAPDARLVAHLRLQAAKAIYDGRPSPTAQRHIARCTAYHAPTRAVVLFTRDAGMHASGWWKNPDYDRCLHLSLSFMAMERGVPVRLPFDRKMGKRWAQSFFGEHCKRLWLEGPFSDEGKSCGVHHYRLFCDKAWNPVLPRGEVYSRDWTPAGWKSWSDVHSFDNGDGAFGAPMEVAR